MRTNPGIEQLLDDVRHGVRILTTAPGLTVTGALLLALVVGGSATAYSMINALLGGRAPGVTATDLVAFSIAGLQSPLVSYADYEILAAVSLVACYAPARRASRIDPVQALRQE